MREKSGILDDLTPGLTSNRVMIDKSSIHNILVIKLRAIGDVLLSTVVLKNLRTAFPAAQIDFLTQPPSRGVVEGNPFVNSVMTFDPGRQHGLRLVREIRRRRYDLVIDLFGNPRSAVVAYTSGARYRVGYRFRWRQHCYNIVVEPRGGEVHNTEFNLDALRAIDVPVVDTTIRFPLNGVDRSFADSLFLQHHLEDKFVVALNPGGGWYTKRWRPQQYAMLGDQIAREDQGEIIVLWGPEERSDAERIHSLMIRKPILIPETNLKQLAAIVEKCDLMITNDSGPMHIAAAVETPVVAIFGPTNPELQGPVGTPNEIVQHQHLLCLGCNLTTCPIKNPCMEELTVDEVYAAFRLLTNKVRKTATLTT